MKDNNLSATNYRLRLMLDLSAQLIGTPHHLGEHRATLSLPRTGLTILCPSRPRLAGRQVVESDKVDIAVLEFIKMAVLGLDMLSCMALTFDLFARHKDLADVEQEDSATYVMVRKADKLGTFQVESCPDRDAVGS